MISMPEHDEEQEDTILYMFLFPPYPPFSVLAQGNSLFKASALCRSAAPKRKKSNATALRTTSKTFSNLD